MPPARAQLRPGSPRWAVAGIMSTQLDPIGAVPRPGLIDHPGVELIAFAAKHQNLAPDRVVSHRLRTQTTGRSVARIVPSPNVPVPCPHRVGPSVGCATSRRYKDELMPTLVVSRVCVAARRGNVCLRMSPHCLTQQPRVGCRSFWSERCPSRRQNILVMIRVIGEGEVEGKMWSAVSCGVNPI